MTSGVATNCCHLGVKWKSIHKCIEIVLIVCYVNCFNIFSKLLPTENVIVGIWFVSKLKNLVNELLLGLAHLLHNFHTNEGSKFYSEMSLTSSFGHLTDCLFAELQKFVKRILRYISKSLNDAHADSANTSILENSNFSDEVL